MQAGLNKFNHILKSNLLLLILVTILFFLNFYTRTIFYRPSSMHQWRQTDCLSITKNYYEEGMRFFEPKIHYQGPKDGKAVSELPILNYTVAALWKIFGEHEFIYRLLEYLIFITAIFVLFNTILRFFRSALLGFFTVSVFLTSPLLTFYSLNFIADVPALSFGIICFCFFLTFYHTKIVKYFYWALLFGTLAVLMKASALMGLSLLMFFSLLDLSGLNTIFKTEKLFTKKLLPISAICLSAALVFSWYKFALSYNENDTNNIFLLTVLPIWDMEEQEVIRNLKVLFNNLFPVFLSRPMFFLFFTLVLFVMTKFRNLGSFYKYSFIFSGIFFVFYVLFFFKVFSVHDYYLINLMIFPVITLLCFAKIVSGTFFIANNMFFARAIVIGLIIFNSFHAAAIYRLRMIEKDRLVYWYPFLSEDEDRLYQYLIWDYGNSIKRIENFTPELRSHGIKREDFVLSIPDQSFDISLYFMDQKGFTIAREHFMTDSLVAVKFLDTPVKYLVLSDTTLKKEKAFRRIAPHFESLFIKDKVEVFRLKSAPL